LTHYVDTGVLLKRYVAEVDSAAADALIAACPLPLPLPLFLEVELTNALVSKHGRGDITGAELQGALDLFRDELESGLLRRPNLAMDEVLYRAKMLSLRHGATTLARTMDIVHVAAALELGCTHFLSTDHRQRQVAKLNGLRVLPARPRA
jgi:hypothetical protein